MHLCRHNAVSQGGLDFWSCHAGTSCGGDSPLAAVAQGAQQVGVRAAPAAARADPTAALPAAAALAAVGAHQAVHSATRLSLLQLRRQVRQDVPRAALCRQQCYVKDRSLLSITWFRCYSWQGAGEHCTALPVPSHCLKGSKQCRTVEVTH